MTIKMFLFSTLFFFCVSLVKTENEYFNTKIPFNTTITDFQQMQDYLQWTDIMPYIQMIDASTKIPSGIGVLSLYDLGNFDECYNIQTPNVTGKYCLGSITLPSSQKIKRNVVPLHAVTPRESFFGTSFQFATCAPSFLTAEEINKFTLTEITESQCYTKDGEPDLSTPAIVTIVILAVIVGIGVTQTIYDIILYYTKQQPAHELLIAFSFLTNGKKLLSKSTNPDQLLCLNGIRALSMMWVVIGHVFQVVNDGPLANSSEIFTWMNDVGNMYIIGATVSVDTFFLLGGMVTVYTFLKAKDKGVKFNIFMYYIHRYLRLTPAYAILILIQRNLFPYVEKAPMWGTMYSVLVAPCIDHWWQSLLYIGNYFGLQLLCIGQGWYLNVDMQLFFLSPLILIPLIKWRKYALYALYILIIGGCVAPFVTVYALNLKSTFTDPNYMTGYYFQTYARFGPYVIGMLFGYYIYNFKKSKKPIIIPKIYVFFIWLISLAVMVACVYAGQDFFSFTKESSLTGTAFYLGLNRQAWSAAVGVVVFLCVFGYGGPINDFLSLHIFQFITKLSYSIYLIHVPLITVRYSILKSPIMFSSWAMFHYFWGDFMFSLILAVPYSLLFESPIIILEKYIFGKR